MMAKDRLQKLNILKQVIVNSIENNQGCHNQSHLSGSPSNDLVQRMQGLQNYKTPTTNSNKNEKVESSSSVDFEKTSPKT